MENGNKLWFPLFLYQAIGLCVGKNDRRFEPAGFFCVHHGIGYDDNNIAGLYFAGGRAAETYRTRTSISYDDVGRETFSVIIIHDRDLHVRDQISGVQQILVDSDATDLV